ncbi:hypothetical protein ACC839_03845 [Rhizobium ruizarguesonis]|uniref:hypothetical protein n=1 Tax=Rhizobium ruizarguesonis TaxID=2081791 RepID=UPI0013EEB067|nr:hypothetical protein [Rhizobium ruizarguesonis]
MSYCRPSHVIEGLERLTVTGQVLWFEGETHSQKLPETDATEIQVCGMRGDWLAQRGECVEYYDIIVRGDEDAEGDIPELEEHENLTEQEMNAKVAEVEAKYGLSAEHVWGFY